MEFDVGQCLTIMKAIIELTDSSGGSGLVQNKPHRGKRFENSVIVFYVRDGQILPSHHKKPPLYDSLRS